METKYTQEQIDEMAKKIGTLEHYGMCMAWRNANAGSPYFRNDLITSEGKSLGDIYQERLFGHFGGFTPEISKSIGWD
jgi:hypothetical protein